MENMTIDVNLKLVITDEDVDDVMCTALEGGICYWCRKAEVVGEYLGEYAHEQISKGGTLLLHDKHEGKIYELTKDKLLNGIKAYVENPRNSDCVEVVDHELRLDTCYVDAEVADSIVQLAVFGDFVYG